MTNIAVERSPEHLDSVDEEQLLGQLRAAARGDRHVFMVVKGVPGTGKSHLVRWLKERFIAGQEQPAKDEVLLIERAHSSLRGTLTQLLDSKIFDEVTSRQQLDRIRNAAVTLSDRQVGEMLLNNLQVGTIEGKMPDGSPPMSRFRVNAPEFLLYPTIRRHLMDEDASPIKRIVRFLTEGRGQRPPGDPVPEFEPDDFRFPLRLVQEIDEKSSARAKNLATDLYQMAKIREEFVRFLNGLLPFAIERTTALSGEDLKEIFYDLRRALRRQDRGLVLFIEDITSFTGLDSALMDVLVTQHTGEAGREFCRMISIIGVTDARYQDFLQDNYQDRMTHLVSLKVGSDKATPIGTPLAMSTFVGRYLNALRLSHDDLERWATANHADPGELPSFCAGCQYRSTCHPAFGAVAQAEDLPEERRIGLYPFNEQALWTMFESLSPARASKTPRSLLRSIVQYVLQSHGRLIEQGAFPPPPAKLGDDFETPPLAKYLQEQTIQREAGDQEPAVQTLVRVWGDRTVDATDDGRIGGLTPAVFTAFDLLPIEGEKVAGGRSSETGTSPAKQDGVTRPTGGKTTGSPPGAVTGTEVKPTGGDPPRPPEPEAERDAGLLAAWAQGEPLQRYTAFAERLQRFLTGAIDWAAHGVPPELVGDRLTPGRIYLVGQVGASRHADQIEFARSPLLHQVLLAIGEIQAATTAPTDPAAIGGAIGTVARWLRAEEPRIVAFVKQPAGNVPAPMPLIRLAIRTNLALGALRGTIPLAATARPDDLYLALIANAGRGRTEKPTKDEWLRELNDLRLLFRKTWGEVNELRWRMIDAAQVRATLIASLQLARGSVSASSDGTIFFDAATALDELAAFTAEDWTFATFDANSSGWAATWAAPTEAWRVFAVTFGKSAGEARASMSTAAETIKLHLGEDTAGEIVEAIDATLQFLRSKQLPYPSELTEAGRLKADEVEAAVRQLEEIVAAQGDLPTVSVMTTATPSVPVIHATAKKIADFANFVASDLELVAKELERVGSDESAEGLAIQQTNDAYDRVLSVFAGIDGQDRRAGR